MNPNILLITPPFTQLNTPYPATAYIKGFLNTQGVESVQMDLGIETTLELFSKKGLTQLFADAADKLENASTNARRIYELRDDYIQSIDSVIKFLQGRDSSLAHYICGRILPEASKFQEVQELDWAFGTMGIQDQGKHLATLYLEDIGDFIVEILDPYFGFSRYAERLSSSALSFDELYAALKAPPSFITQIMLSILKIKIENEKPDLVCFSVPFPGNLFATFMCGAWLKQHHPNIKIAMGGGYPNTELRSLSDERVFEFVDYISLDDGEQPMLSLLAYLKGEIELFMLKRTFALVDGKVVYCNGSLFPDIKQSKVGTPDYSGLTLDKYLSVIQIINPMHRLWSDGRWNKLTMAHGCYWGKCTFCDISLDYIKNYEASSATLIVDRMEELVAQTGERGFHFVDEAAPPALMKAVALEILKRKLLVNWWTNIRFEKSFTLDLCRILAASGCIAVSGGLEVASDRLLKLIAKGVTIEQVATVNDNFYQADIMVHAYLMYGFPTQTAQETIDSLEVVRQMFEEGILQSAFWHRFAMTAHSPVGMMPEAFKVKNRTNQVGTFANNDLEHDDPTGAKHSLFSEGLKTSLYNYMHGIGLDLPLKKWFDHKVPRTSIPKNLISSYVNKPVFQQSKPNHRIVWIGGNIAFNPKNNMLNITHRKSDVSIECDSVKGHWLSTTLMSCRPQDEPLNFSALRADYEQNNFADFLLFWHSTEIEELKTVGLLVL